MKNKKSICRDCGGPVCGYSQRCERCKHAHNNETARRVMAEIRARDRAAGIVKQNNYQQAHRREMAERTESLGSNAKHLLTVVRDPRPIDDGGFRPGSQFYTIEIRAMLDNRDGAILDGTIFETDARARYIVTGGKLSAWGAA